MLSMPLLDLSRSEARRRLLTLFFADPAKEYHLRDLERRVGMSLGAVQNVVGKLERKGMLVRRRLGNLALFSLNQRHPVYAETAAVVAKTIGIAPSLAREIAEVPGVRLAFLYGSYVSIFSASGSTWSADSDIDLLIVGGADPRAVSRVAREAGKRSGRQVNATVLRAKELRDKIAHHDSFVEEVLSKPILPLSGFPRTEPSTSIRRTPAQVAKLLG